jgi:glycosyltransferase involved in cell wall biosynthesis
MRVSVVVPTYRRPERLRACLRGLRAQHRAADEIVVVRRRDDELSRAVLAEHTGELREVVVDEPGVVRAMMAGFVASAGEVIALTDDDAVPRPDWVARIAAGFADPALGVLGGRDVLAHCPEPGPGAGADVGRLSPWGRLVGNHHTGRGGPRDVDVLKGVNLAVRREAAALPAGLRGPGAQPHWEVALCQWARGRGWRVVYDADLLVDHYPAERPAGDHRGGAAPADVQAEAYNLVAGLLSQRPDLTWRRAAFGLAVGDAAVPGLARAAYALLRRDHRTVRRLVPSLAGQLAALHDLRGGRLPRAAAVAPSPDPLLVTLVAHDVHDDGGMERVQAELLRRAGSRVAFTVVSTRLAPDLRHRVVRWQRIPAPRRPFPLRFAAFYVLAGLRLRRRTDQLVHTCGAIVPNRVDLATVHLCHAGLTAAMGRLAPPDLPASRRLNTALTRVLSLLAERWTYGRPRARALAAVSVGLRGELLSHYPRASVVLTPNGVDVARYRPDPATRARVRAEQETSENELVALFVGGDWARKGLRTAIEALQAADRAGVDGRLWVIGSGDEARYREHTRRLGVAGRVRFLGERADAERFYCGADVFVLPTMYETFSLVAHEAAAAGLPLVIPPVNGAADLVGRDEAGILVAPTAESVAAALILLAGDAELRTRLGEEGRRRVTGRTWQASADRVVEVYRELAASARPTAAGESQPRRTAPEVSGAR